ncbi:Homeodomain-like protein, partial [Conidiobolus coronatus NRRL 28638]
RNRLKPHQTKILTHFFLRNPRPTPEERIELTKSTGMSIREIQVWFQNHRAKIKKEKDIPEE